MKKFLFTLTALLLAGTAFAGRIYVEDVEFTADQLGKQQFLPVYIELDNEYVNGWELYLTYPEGVTAGTPRKNTAVLNQMIPNADGDEELVVPLGDCLATKIVQAYGSAGYWDPQDDGTFEAYGSVKLGPTGTYKLYDLRVTPSADFTSGDIVIKWMYSGGYDARNGQTGVQSSTSHPHDDEGRTELIVHLTVEQPQAQPAPTPTISDDGTKVTAAIAGDTEHTVVLELWDAENEKWVVVDNPYNLPAATFEEQVLKFRAKTTAIEGVDSEDSPYTEEYTVTIRAKEDNQCPQPEWAYYEVVNEVWARVEYYGAAPYTEYVDLYIVTTNDQGEEVLTPVDNPYTDLPTENNTYEDIVVKFKAIVRADGEVYNINNEGYYTVTIPGKEKDYAPTPKINNDGTVVTAAVENDNPEAPHTVVLEYWNAETEEWVVVEDGSYELPEPTFETQTIKFRAYTKKNGEYYDSPYCDEVTVTIDPKDSKKAPAPTFRVDGDKLYAEQGDLTVELYKKNDDGTWTKVDNPYEGLPTENTSYTDPIVIEFKAITLADGVTYNLNSDEVPYTYELAPLTKKTANKPTIEGANLTDATYDIVITPDPNTDGALEYTVNPAAPGKAAAETLTYERKDADYYVHVKAWTTEGDTYLASEVAEEDILIPAKPAPKVYEVADPTISVDNSDPTKTVITIEATEGDLTYNIDAEEGVVYTVEEVDGKVIITVVNGDETAFVTVTATTTLTEVPAGYDEVKNGEAKKNVEIPQYQQTAAPTIDVSFGGEDGAHYANVTFVNNDAKPATIEYSLDNGETWLPYTGAPVVITTYGETTVLARATAEGKATSEVAERSFTLSDDATSVNELVNGKTVAGVRYFNMAGQEMQEANGITIVVTTYTDGTTTAVKVMK